MDTTLKRYGNKLMFKTHDPAEEPIEITWQAKGELMAKGKPKHDGSGRGVRANRGRGGCKSTQTTGKGRK